jgi:hypothetical protein
LLSGHKPALRLLRSPRRALAEAAAARRRGFAAEVAVLDDQRALVYIATTAAAARDLCALERAIRPGLPPRVDGPADLVAHRDLGLALGFPRCCIDRFVARIERGADRLPNGWIAHEDFIAASEAAARSIVLDSRCNVFAADRTSGWLSHVPCRFDCAASLAYADRLIAAYRRHAPADVLELERRLLHYVAIDRDGHRSDRESAAPDACHLGFTKPA